MTDKNWQAGGRKLRLARAAACAGVIAVPAWAMARTPADFSPASLIGSADPSTIWELAIGGLVIAAFLAALVLWSASAVRRIKRMQMRRNALVSTALNNLGQGIVMTDADRRIVFCNDRYLQIYGLSRSDICKGMTGRDLAALRRQRGVLGASVEEFYEKAEEPGGHIFELPGDRSIIVKVLRLPNGASVATHEECTEERRLARQLAATKNFLELVMDNVPVCIAAKSIGDGRYIFANRAFERFSGLPRERIVGSTAHELYTPKTAEVIERVDRAAIESPDGRNHGQMTIDRAGKACVLAYNRVVVRNDRGEPEFLVALFDDVTERNSLSEQLENAKKFLDLVVDNIPISLTVQRISDRRYLLANRRAETILNRSREEAMGLTSADLFNPREASLIASRDNAAITKGGMHAEEHPISTRDGLRLFLTRRVTVADESGTPKYLIKTHEDVTDQRQTESRMAHMAYHDGLTDLPNRAAFLKALTQMIEACDGTAEEFAVLSMDLDGLKDINDVFGHALGDKLLIDVARRIQAAAQGAVVARLSGDEFGLIIDGTQPDAGLALARQLTEAMGSEFIIDGKSVRVGVTTGIAVFPRNGTDAAALLANAGAALFRAKAHSRGSISVFQPEMDQQIRDRRALHQDLSTAIRKGELSLHYQPLAKAGHADGREVVGFEALVRWTHPTRGYVPPGDFIPLAEESGLIVGMGEWILREACREAATWANPLQIAVNLSPVQFTQGDLVGLVHSILLETGLQPARLELEITEGVLIEDFERGLGLLRRLKALGVRISMDDFGSGYSSLTYLQAFPFDKIKIDRAFVVNLGRSPQSAAIVRAVIGLGHGLDVSIVAEGVETSEQLGFLAEERCDVVQGYLIGKPAPIEQYATLVGKAGPEDMSVIRKAS
jgi:diguanylate cyclase (GGDEF)-like protein/PAS domain S-box-containing protein